MATPTRSNKPQIDDDGVRIVAGSGVRSGVWLLVAAIGVVVLALILLVRGMSSAPVDEIAAPAKRPAAPAQHGSPQTASQQQAARLPKALPPSQLAEPPPPEAEAPPLSAEDAAALQAAMDEAEQAAQQGDAPTGIALFPPPGTDPLKRGIIVPDGYELPPGYMRHYQTTDDGKQLPAILMFHPDYQPLDDSGNRLELPSDLVVPPEMAPPGLAVEMLDVPDQGVPMVEVPPAASER